MGSYSTNIGLIEPTPFDPSVANAWGALLNTNFTLIDSAIAGLLPLSVAGNSNVILTATQGSANQARNIIFKFTGTLTGNITVFWPQSTSQGLIVNNATSGAYSLTLAVNNGSGSPAGATVAIAQSTTNLYYSDGTNIVQVAAPASTSVGGDLSGTASSAQVISTHLGSPLPVAQGGTAVTSYSALYAAQGGGSMGQRAVTIQSGGSPSGGSDGDVFFIY